MGLTELDYALIADVARGTGASPALRALQRRIDEGELTWVDITRGWTRTDPGVRLAVDAGFPPW
ncbi:hypothetical protein GCM10023148_27210 [Actinokineospora soli]